MEELEKVSGPVSDKEVLSLNLSLFVQLVQVKGGEERGGCQNVLTELIPLRDMLPRESS